MLTTTTLHDCPVTTNPGLKHAEENLVSSDVEVPPPSEVPISSPSLIQTPLASLEFHVLPDVSQPLSEGSTLSTLSTTFAFNRCCLDLGLVNFDQLPWNL